MPTTRPQRGASASARRPRPVPTSRTVRSARSSSARSFRKAGLMSTGDGPIGRGRDEARIFRHDAPRVAGLRLLDGLQPLLELGGRELDVEATLLDVDQD